MSRLRKNIATIFDVFTEVAAPRKSDHASPSSGEAWILWKYPEDYDDKQKLKSITDFSFPSGVVKNKAEAVQLFSFALTDDSSQYTFGYCRFTPKTNTCLCILSGLPWTNLFYKLLNHVASVMNDKTEEELEALLVRAYHQEVPHPGEVFSVESSLGKNKLEVHCPDHTRLPTISDNRHLMEYYSAVNEDHMISIFASMLRERRIVITSQKLSQLSSCVMAANLLIYPLHWQHIFVPVLPEKLFPYLSAPMPFLIGVSTAGFESAIVGVDMSEVVVLDIDRKTISSPYEDWKHLPPEVMGVLKSNLRRSNHMLGDGLARSFLRAMVVVLGGYRLGFTQSGDQIKFDTDKFIAKQKVSSKLRDYLAEFRHLQIFAEFIQDRLDSINAGEPVQDEFESEAKVFERHGGAKDLVIEKGMGAWSDIQGRMSRIKEASMKPQGMSPPNMRKLQRPISAAQSMVKEKIPKYRQSKNRESLRNQEEHSYSTEKRKPGFIGFSDDLTTDSVEAGRDALYDSDTERLSEKLFSDNELDDIVNKRTSILVRYDSQLDEQSKTDEKVKSSKSLSDLLSLEIPGAEARSTGCNDNFLAGEDSAVPEPEYGSRLQTTPWLTPVAERGATGFRVSLSAVELQRRGSPNKTPSPVSAGKTPPNNEFGTNLIDLGPPKLDWNEGMEDVKDVMIFDPLAVGGARQFTPHNGRTAITSSTKPPTREAALPDVGAGNRPTTPLASISNNLELLEEIFLPEKAHSQTGQPGQKWEIFE